MTADDPRPAGEAYSDGVVLWGPPCACGCCYGQGPHRHGVSSNTNSAASGGATDGERIQRQSIGDALENDRCGICGSVDHFREDCPVASQADGKLLD